MTKAILKSLKNISSGKVKTNDLLNYRKQQSLVVILNKKGKKNSRKGICENQ